MSIEPVRLKILLPKNSLLPKARESLAAVSKILDRALEPAKRFRRVRNDVENDLHLAVGVHALNGLDAARAVHALSNTDYAATVFPHSRTAFEALLKIRWMLKDPHRASAYLTSEPFERYAHANSRVRASNKWPGILKDCETAFAQNPELAKLPKALSGDGTPNFKAIAKALRMPRISEMVEEMRMGDDIYLLDFDFPSFYPHTSVLHTKTFAKGVNLDGTAAMSTKLDPILLLGVVARTATQTGEILEEVLSLYPDGAVQFDAEKVVEELNNVVTTARGYMPDAGGFF